MDTDLEWRFFYPLVGRRDVSQKPREAEREREDARDRAESIVRKIDKAKGMVRETRERECKTRSNAARGISE